jgi:hypothetical protein
MMCAPVASRFIAASHCPRQGVHDDHGYRCADLGFDVAAEFNQFGQIGVWSQQVNRRWPDCQRNVWLAVFVA